MSGTAILPPLLPASEEKHAHTYLGAGRCTAPRWLCAALCEPNQLRTLSGHRACPPSHMDEITRLIKDLIRLLQTIAVAVAEVDAKAEEDYCGLLESAKINELKEELGSWFIAGYPLYQGS